MGAWGTALFSDDTACDIRDNYRDLVGDGLTGIQATDKLLKDWAEAIADEDDGPVFWLALAATQWKAGRLEERVKLKALEVIVDGTDLVKWEKEPKDHKKRKEVLERLALQLISPQPALKRIPRRIKSLCDWEKGDIIQYKLLSGNSVYFNIVNLWEDNGGTYPVISAVEQVAKYHSFRELATLKEWQLSRTLLTGSSKLSPDRVVRTGMKAKFAPVPDQCTVINYKELDDHLKVTYGLK